MSFKFRIRRIRTTQNALASATATAKPACATAEKDLLGKHATAIYVLPVKKKKMEVSRFVLGTVVACLSARLAISETLCRFFRQRLTVNGKQVRRAGIFFCMKIENCCVTITLNNLLLCYVFANR